MYKHEIWVPKAYLCYQIQHVSCISVVHHHGVVIVVSVGVVVIVFVDAEDDDGGDGPHRPLLPFRERRFVNEVDPAGVAR